MPLKKQRLDKDINRGKDSFIVQESFVNQTWMVDQRNLKGTIFIHLRNFIFQKKQSQDSAVIIDVDAIPNALVKC